MPELYMFYLGGNAGRSNIEVHDIQFAAVETPEEAWPLLRDAWFGDPDKVHLDGYAIVRWADGYDIVLSPEPVESDRRLFFVNVGGYRKASLAELHEFGLFVATDAAGAKARALASLLDGADQKHKDNLKDVDNCLLLDRVGAFHLGLKPNPEGRAPHPAWQGYQPIGL